MVAAVLRACIDACMCVVACACAPCCWHAASLCCPSCPPSTPPLDAARPVARKLLPSCRPCCPAEDVELKAVHPSVGALLAWRHCQLLTAMPRRSTGEPRPPRGGPFHRHRPLLRAHSKPSHSCSPSACLACNTCSPAGALSTCLPACLQRPPRGSSWRGHCMRKRPSAGWARRRKRRLARWTPSR